MVELEKAQKMITEASKILHHLQFAIGVELVDDAEQETITDPDNQGYQKSYNDDI